MAKVYVRGLRLSERLRIEEEYEKLQLLGKKQFYATNVHDVIKVQTIYRGNKLRKNYVKKICATVTIQSIIRLFMVRKHALDQIDFLSANDVVCTNSI